MTRSRVASLLTGPLPAVLQREWKGPVVIPPFYGEYGYFLLSYVRIVHYLKSPHKIVCCRRGDEAYFPSAAEFFYAWRDIYPDSEKCGFRNEWPIARPRRYTKEETHLEHLLRKQFPRAAVVRIDEPIPFNAVAHFPVPIEPRSTLGPCSDIVVCARKRAGSRHGHGKRNFRSWRQIIRPLRLSKLSVGQVGLRNTSYILPGVTRASWQAPRATDAMIEMLTNAQLYVGTDTGPTHLAAMLGTPMILFRSNQDDSPDTIRAAVLPVAQRKKAFVRIVDAGWQKPDDVVRTVLEYLRTPVSARER